MAASKRKDLTLEQKIALLKDSERLSQRKLRRILVKVSCIKCIIQYLLIHCEFGACAVKGAILIDFSIGNCYPLILF